MCLFYGMMTTCLQWILCENTQDLPDNRNVSACHSPEGAYRAEIRRLFRSFTTCSRLIAPIIEIIQNNYNQG